MACGALCLCAVCAGPGRRGVERKSNEGTHWIQDLRLREAMHSLEREQMTLWPQEIEDERAGSRLPAAKFERAAATAGSLADTAERIGQAVTDAAVPEVDRRSFLALVDTLADQARQLQAAAERHDLVRMQDRAAAIESTCVSCHERFRDIAGPR